MRSGPAPPLTRAAARLRTTITSAPLVPWTVLAELTIVARLPKHIGALAVPVIAKAPEPAASTAPSAITVAPTARVRESEPTDRISPRRRAVENSQGGNGLFGGAEPS